MKPSLIENQQIQLQQSVEFGKKENKFKQFLDQKVKKIQQTKIKTITMTEKYFSDLKQKIDKYLLKQQKKMLNSYEDNINMSINCMTHNFLYDIEKLCIRNQKNLSQSRPMKQNESKVKVVSNQSQNQLAIKLQVKKLLQEMILTENYLNETIKIIGEQLKVQIQKVIQPLGNLFSNIPKLAQISSNSSTLLIKDVKSKNQCKKGKQVIRSRKSDFEVKNPEISSQRMRIAELNMDDQSEITDKMIQKSNTRKESIVEVRLQEQKPSLLRLSAITEKEDKIALRINKLVKNARLIDYDLVNGKSLFHVYQRQIVQEEIKYNELNHEGRPAANQQIAQTKYLHEIYLNDKRIMQQQIQSQWKYEKHSNIQFQSKPNRDYLLILSSKTQQDLAHTYKIFQISIYNYKGDLIAKDPLHNFKVPETQKVVNVFQIESLRQFIFIVLNNHVKRLSLKSQCSQKMLLYGNDDKITRAESNSDKLILFEGRKMNLQVLTSNLVLLQRFAWTTIYPAEIHLHRLINIKLHQLQGEISHQELKTTSFPQQLTFVIPRTKTDTLHYIQNGFLKTLSLDSSDKLLNGKQKNIQLQQIKSIMHLDHGVYLILSIRTTSTKNKHDLFLLEIINSLDKSSDHTNNPRGKLSYLQAINEDILDCKFIKNQLYLQMKSGKVSSFCIC